MKAKGPHQTISLLNKYGRNKDHYIASFNAHDGKIIDSSRIYEDFGDYAPFLFYYGFKSEIYPEFNSIKKIIKKNKIYYKKRSGLLGQFIYAYDQTDLILGLLSYMRNEPSDIRVKDTTQKILENYLKNFTNNKKSFAAVDRFFRIKLPLFSANDNGMIIELLCNFYTLTENKKYLKNAHDLAKGMIELNSFKKYGLFFNYSIHSFAGNITKLSPLVKKDLNKLVIHKHNNNTLYSFIELYRITRDKTIKNAIYYWFKSLKNHMVVDNFIISQKNIKTNQYSRDLTIIHALEVLCDCYEIFKDKSFIEFVELQINKILSQQHVKTGLIPFYDQYFKYNLDFLRLNIPLESSWLDTSIDFGVLLAKLYELTNKKNYLVAFNKLYTGLLRYHWYNKGVINIVDYTTGKPLNYYCAVKTAFLSLKIFIAKEHIGRIYKNPKVFDILRDR